MREKLLQAFKEKFGHGADVIAFAPGRLEILGNHTDYNEGYVLSTAVNLGTFFAARKIEGETCTVATVADMPEGNERTFNLTNLMEKVDGDWSNYVKGVLVELQKCDLEVPAFEAMIISDIPLSAGMSSSAALEVSVTYGVAKLIEMDGDENIFDRVSKGDWARIGQGAENNYVGAQTGLLDQFSSIMGQKDHLVFSDFRKVEVQAIPLPHHVAMVVANTNVKHDLTADYGERRQRCEEAAAYFNSVDATKTHLRDVSMEELLEAKPKLSENAFNRAMHVVGEDERVLQGVGLLIMGNVEEFGTLMYKSQLSSQYNFDNSCPELDVLVDEGTKLPGYIGARLSGGGFGGISVHFVDKSQAGAYAKALEVAYQKRTGKACATIICTSGEGAYVGCP